MLQVVHYDDDGSTFWFPLDTVLGWLGAEEEAFVTPKSSAGPRARAAARRRPQDSDAGATTNEVKGYLGLKLRNVEAGYRGGLEMLDAHGITESKYDAHEQMDAFKSSGMGDRQVRDAKAKYDFLSGSTNTEIKQYLGLKVLNAKDGYAFAKDFLKDVGGARGWGG